MAPQVWRVTASEALRAFSSGSLTIEAYCEALLQRIEERDDAVRAWEFLKRRSEILDEARELDKVPREKRGPLHGIPVAIKDIIYTRDMPTGHGFYSDPSQPHLDAASVVMLRNAGAILIGKTTTTAFAANYIGTKTRNAHSTSHTPGGSSSGSGAAVADFQVPLALGSQTGGSVVRPASFNGVLGFKPTWNAISREGQKIFVLETDTLGYFARSVEDLELLSEVFGLRDDGPPPKPLSSGVQGLRFAFFQTPQWPHAGPGTQAAFAEGKKLLQAAGAEVEDIEAPAGFEQLEKWHFQVLRSEGRVSFRPEYQTDRHALPEDLRAHVEEKHGITRAEQLAATDGIAAWRPRWDEIAAKYDAVVVPSVPDEAPEGLATTGSSIFCCMWSSLHVPVVNVPGFQGKNGLPIGLSLVRPRYQDRGLLNLARAVERVWWKKK